LCPYSYYSHLELALDLAAWQHMSVYEIEKRPRWKATYSSRLGKVVRVEWTLPVLYLHSSVAEVQVFRFVKLCLLGK